MPIISWKMYQNIDDIDGNDAQTGANAPRPANKARNWLILIVIIGFGVMLAAAIWKQTQKPNVFVHPSQQTQAIEAFRDIQSEPQTALRRARLIDYVATHETSPVIHAAKQQLEIMDKYESRDWSILSNIMFVEQATQADKLFELNRYIDRWGEGLIGTRDAEISAFRQTLTTEAETPEIDRRHKPDSSPIPESIDGSQMAGGQRARPIVPRYPTVRRTITPTPQARKTVEIEPLRVRRARTPDYPRKAFSRRIPAIVELSFNVDTRGRVALVKAVNVKASRYERDFERAAIRAARGTRYYPRKEDGVPTPVIGVRKTYVFDPDVR